MSIYQFFVPLEIATHLKNKGFNEDCLAYYSNRFGGGNEFPIPVNQLEGCGIGTEKNSDFEGNSYFIATTPLYHQVQIWFKEKHGLDLDINCSADGINAQINALLLVI